MASRLFLAFLTAVAATQTPCPHYKTIDGSEVVYFRPKTTTGVLFVAHGCSHAATDWFDRCDTCSKCGVANGEGLPQEKQVVDAALSRGLTVIAISSLDRWRKCWSIRDLLPVTRALKKLRSEFRIQNLPLFAFGASSGGAFVGQLPSHIKMAGVIVQISGTRLVANYPPAVFMHMERDTRTSAFVAKVKARLKERRVPVLAIAQPPTPITPHFFSKHISNITVNMSEALFVRLRQGSFLHQSNDPKLKGLFLSQDPRLSSWRNWLRRDKRFENLPLDPDESPISEMMNVAFAQHELYSRKVDEALDFLSKCQVNR